MQKKRILVIDDEAHFTKLLKMNLEKKGSYEVRTENRGTIGLAAAKEFKPDLILLDIMMPDVSGAELAQQFKEDAQTKNTPLVFLTALATRGDTQSRGGVIGSKLFIAKTATSEEMLEAIGKYVS